MSNMIFRTDSYKFSHWLQNPPGTEYQNSYIESRGGKWDKTVFFGLQMFLLEYLSNPITQKDINDAAKFCAAHGVPFNLEGWEGILKDYNGYLPIRIEAVPEGTVMPTHNVLVQVVNTDPKYYWVTSYVETALLRAVWYPTTVTTNSYICKEIIWKYLKETSDDPASQIAFKLHDFGSRGVSSAESAGLGGAAHLVNFMGTDTVEGALFAKEYYGEEMAGFSIPAAEHSTITSWGGPEYEVDAFRNMLTQFAKPGSLVAVVSDSYDIWNAIYTWGSVLKEEVLKSGATIVVRPDSGDPETIPVLVIQRLMEHFGYAVNSKGYKVLPSCVRVIQGDGITFETIETILSNMKKVGLSADNIAFGQGGGLLQQVNRDTLKFAMKCSAVQVNGVWKDVWKNPVTDKSKQSKRGILALTYGCGLGSCGYRTIRKENLGNRKNLLEPVWENGVLLKRDSFANIRERANKAFN